MRALVLNGDQIAVDGVPDPEPLPGHAIVQVDACGICGTDHRIFRDHLVPEGTILGHEFAGTIEDVDERLRDWRAGDRVTVLPLPYCGRCHQCRNGQENLCREGLAGTIGCGHAAGGLAERVRVPATALRRLPDRMDPRQGALVEPVAVAMHAVNLGRLTPGQRVGIIGLGPMGLFAGLIARLQGALVFGLDERPSRVAFAHTLGLGAFQSEDRADERIRELTQGGPDVVIEAGGRPESIERGAVLSRVGGRVVVVASYHAPTQVRPGDWLNRGVSLHPSIAYTTAEFDRALELIATEQVDVRPFLTRVYGLERGQTVFEGFETQNEVMKLLFDPSQ